MNPIDPASIAGPREKAKLLLDFMHRSMMHHVLWYTEIAHQYGRERAMKMLDTAWDQSMAISMQRLSRVLGFEMEDGLPLPLLNLKDETMDAMLSAVAGNWLATDGLWFQAVERQDGMSNAKRCNDSCWAQFSPLEAWSVKRLLGMGEAPGLEGLKAALQYRLYAYINKQSIQDDGDKAFIFRMEECRVQAARRRKGMEDYPCKSAGIVEFTEFARGIDSRIRTECLSCPPDSSEQDCYCSWRFSMAE
jgi:hypothetical protein